MSREIANRHWSDAFEALVHDLGGEYRRIGAVDAFLGNLPLPFANGCLALEPTMPEDLDAAVTWVEAAGVPFQVRIDKSVFSRLAPVIAAHTLVEDEPPLPAMVLSPIPEPPPTATGVTVAPVTAATYGQFVELMVASGISAEYATQIFSLRLLETHEGAYFLASLEGQPAGISVAVRTGDSGGIYSVATLESARRRGVGSAVTWAAADAIRRWGCSAAVLQSTEMGYPLYQSMGFVEVTRYRRFSPSR